MRNPKADNLKAVQAMVTLPHSLMVYAKSLASDNTWAANVISSHVLGGLTEKEFKNAYTGVDFRSKRDPIHKEFVRAARWICEGYITRKVELSGVIYFYVQWLKTGNEGWVAIDNRKLTSGFVHVIYDNAITDVDMIKRLHNAWKNGGSFKHPINATLSHTLTGSMGFKDKVIDAWMKHWANPGRQYNAQAEVDSRKMEKYMADGERPSYPSDEEEV